MHLQYKHDVSSRSRRVIVKYEASDSILQKYASVFYGYSIERYEYGLTKRRSEDSVYRPRLETNTFRIHIRCVTATANVPGIHFKETGDVPIHLSYDRFQSSKPTTYT